MTLEIIRVHPKPPQGGHHLSAHGMVFRGKDVDEVLERLTAYRTQNSLPLGNPEAELAAYYVEMAPHLVKEGNKPSVNNGPMQRVAERTMAVWYGKYERLLVHSPVVEERQVVCASCPYYEQSLPEPETLYWSNALTKAVLMTGDMACLKKGWCAKHYELIGLFTRLAAPEKVATMPAPDCCWLKAL